MTLNTCLRNSSPRLAAALLLVCAASTALAQDGAYTVEPWNGYYSGVRIQPGDQKIVAVGALYSTNPDAGIDKRLAIARYDASGTADTTYGIGGPSIPPLSGLSAPALGAATETGGRLVLQPDGKAVASFGVLGSGLYDSAHGVARFTTTGALDSGFGGGGWTGLDALSYDFYPFPAGVRLQSTGKIVTSLHGNASPTSGIVARVRSNGILDSGGGGFGPSKSGFVYSTFGSGLSYTNLVVQADDKPVAVGYHKESATYIRRLHVARYTANGSTDWAFNWCGYSVIAPAGISETLGRDVALQSNGKIVVLGNCTGIDGLDDLLVARLNTNGKLDTSFGGGTGYVRLDLDGLASATGENAAALVIQPDGKIVAVGTLRFDSEGAGSVLVVRLNANGTPDATFGSAGFKLGMPPAGPDYHSFMSNAVALQSDGRIIVAGSDDWDGTTASDSHPLLMRFDP